MSNDPLSDLLGRLGEGPDDLTARIRDFGRQAGVTSVLVPKLLLTCAPPGYTVDSMVQDKPDVARQWAEDLDKDGYHITADAIELHYNAAGGFDAQLLSNFGYSQEQIDTVSAHVDHPHVAMTCVAARRPSLERN
jgi:hypothetical protein